MASNTVIDSIQFRRGKKATLTAYYDATNPAKTLKAGEPAVETDTRKLKIGDGVSAYADLPYIGEADPSDGVIVGGYFLNGEFYSDSTYTKPLVHSNIKVYVDYNTISDSTSKVKCYRYVGDTTGFVEITSTFASETEAGVMKLYKSSGENEDGTMTQKAITEGVRGIKLEIADENNNGVIDEGEETLILTLPW